MLPVSTEKEYGCVVVRAFASEGQARVQIIQICPSRCAWSPGACLYPDATKGAVLPIPMTAYKANIIISADIPYTRRCTLLSFTLQYVRDNRSDTGTQNTKLLQNSNLKVAMHISAPTSPIGQCSFFLRYHAARGDYPFQTLSLSPCGVRMRFRCRRQSVLVCVHSA